MLRTLLHKISQKKSSDINDIAQSHLARILNLFDLVGIGVGTGLGLGVYVIPGTVSRYYAGPGVLTSFSIAAVASVIAGLCYAELSARFPRAGCAYIYSFVTIGELVAFIVGWTLIMVYVLGTASIARSLAGHIDFIANNSMSATLKDELPITAEFLSSYPDFLAFGITLLLSFVLAFCVKIFSSIMNITAAINFAVLLFIIIAGSLQADMNNWQIQENQVPEGTEGGKGGFMPFGILGILKGAAIYFQAFIGFDSVASTGEEVTNPQRNIPMASMISLMTVFCGYFGVSGVITLMLPYYYQDADVPILYAFQKTSWGWAQWIVSIGAISSLSTSFLGGMFSLSRLLYAMSSDDLLFKFMGKVHPRFRTPFIGTLCAGVLTGLMALIFDVDELIDMMSVGALVAYSVAAACVLLLRYAKDADNYTETEHADDHFHIKDIVKQIMNTEKLKKPTKLSTFIVTSEIILYIVLCVLVSQLVIQARSSIGAADPLAITGLVILLLCMICIMVSIGIQPTSQATVTYKVPFVPLFPAIGILINIFLMMMLDGVTWIKCGAWTLKGLVIYIVFGFCCHYKKWKSTSNTSPRTSRNSVVVQKTSSRW
ncbi:cationic amino acid transporter 3-like [Schistocerca americana]|uniref:cationic amino acid transporter 3-like n=1 Tax=Schistocerca americana TaxID=7009 RepID=UPI001F4F316B|nr:cationic amino acid transporter 3-like [Schistocerca americana]